MVNITRIGIPATTDEAPVLRLYHDLTHNEWGLATLAVDDLYGDLGGESAAALALVVRELLEEGQSPDGDGYYCYRTDRPEALRAQYEALMGPYDLPPL